MRPDPPTRPPAPAGGPPPLWTLGRPGGGTASFALGPAGWRSFAGDGAVVIGSSDPGRDWPYVHPGPDQGWAGHRVHPFRLLFTLTPAPATSTTAASMTAELVVAALDTSPWTDATALALRLNGAPAGWHDVPRGTPGAGPVDGIFTETRPRTFRFPLPAGALRAGLNEAVLTVERGGWIIYEAVALHAPGFALAPTTVTHLLEAQPLRALVEAEDGVRRQPLRLRLLRAGGPATVPVCVDGAEVARLTVADGLHEHEVLVPAVERPAEVTVEAAGDTRAVTLKPVPRLTVYVVPHSHTDVGYTHHQDAVADRQVANLQAGLAEAARTAEYPAGARFVWNVEVSWAADLFLRQGNATAERALAAAVQAGRVALHGFYLNTLTGLSRPEELVRTFRHAVQLGERFGAPVDTAMISDIPGHTWGLVPALAQAGVRYLSTCPNFFDRIGTAQLASADQPFWWLGPDGHARVLVWNTWQGYALSHVWAGKLGAPQVGELLERLESVGYPYDLTYVRWSGQGDNAAPDTTLADKVRDWNARYAWPRLVISDQRTPFVELERRHGGKLPSRSGDWTPYWEDGAYSTARETIAGRRASDRLTTAQTLWALQAPDRWPAAQADEAWRKVLLVTEHTWGAWNSVSEPEALSVQAQWATKAGYAAAAARAADELLTALPAGAPVPDAFDVTNADSWARTEVVRLSAADSRAGDRVVDAAGHPAPGQRLASGELAFLVERLPPFATRRYRVVAGPPAPPPRPVRRDGLTLASDALGATLDPATGTLCELSGPGGDVAAGARLGEYLYLRGDDPAAAQRCGPPTITPVDEGPLVAALAVSAPAPGCAALRLTWRLEAGSDHLCLDLELDKLRAEGPDYTATAAKESVNLAFPFAVPGGQVRLDLPLGGVMRPDADQIAGSNTNWFTLGSWADVAAPGRGVTWASPDAPLVQVGGLTATLTGSQTDPRAWRGSVGPATTLIAWLMNNHWGTNYRAHQEGPVAFRFALRPHAGYDAVAAARLGAARCRPLVVRAATGPAPDGAPRLVLSVDHVQVVALKPADDGRGLVVRLCEIAGRDALVELQWAEPAPRAAWLSDTLERRGAAVRGAVAVPARGLVTLRVE